MQLPRIILLITVTFVCTSAICQFSPKQFIGTWITKRSDERTYTVTEETWIFENMGKGKWIRKLIMSNGVVTCDVANPFTWKIIGSNRLDMTLAKTSCKCITSNKKYEDGLYAFIENYKASYNNDHTLYKINNLTPEAMTLNNFVLTKK